MQRPSRHLVLSLLVTVLMAASFLAGRATAPVPEVPPALPGVSEPSVDVGVALGPPPGSRHLEGGVYHFEAWGSVVVVRVPSGR